MNLSAYPPYSLLLNSLEVGNDRTAIVSKVEVYNNLQSGGPTLILEQLRATIIMWKALKF